MSSPPGFGCGAWLLMAAGQSRRFEGDKLLQPLPGRAPQRLIDLALAPVPTGFPVYVSISRKAHALQQHLMHASPWHGKLTRILTCPCAEQGMGSVLAWSIDEIRRCERKLKWLGVLLADMPAIQHRTLFRLQSAARERWQNEETGGHNPIKALRPSHNARAGNPVVLHHSLFTQVSTLEGDQGARSLLNTESTETIAVDDAGILLDIDSREEFHRFIHNHLTDRERHAS